MPNAQGSGLSGHDWAQRSEEQARIGSESKGQGATALPSPQQEGDLIWDKGLSLTDNPLEWGGRMKGWEQHLQPTCRRTWWRRCQESR